MCECGTNQLLLELTYNQLLSQTKRGQTIKDSPRESDANKVQIQEVNLIPSIQNKTLTVKSRTRTTEKFYETVIVFPGFSILMKVDMDGKKFRPQTVQIIL